VALGLSAAVGVLSCLSSHAVLLPGTSPLRVGAGGAGARSTRVDALLSDTAETADQPPQVQLLTYLFFLLFLLCATQDIAVDGWAITSECCGLLDCWAAAWPVCLVAGLADAEWAMRIPWTSHACSAAAPQPFARLDHQRCRPVCGLLHRVLGLPGAQGLQRECHHGGSPPSVTKALGERRAQLTCGVVHGAGRCRSARSAPSWAAGPGCSSAPPSRCGWASARRRRRRTVSETVRLAQLTKTPRPTDMHRPARHRSAQRRASPSPRSTSRCGGWCAYRPCSGCCWFCAPGRSAPRRALCQPTVPPTVPPGPCADVVHVAAGGGLTTSVRCAGRLRRRGLHHGAQADGVRSPQGAHGLHGDHPHANLDGLPDGRGLATVRAPNRLVHGGGAPPEYDPAHDVPAAGVGVSQTAAAPLNRQKRPAQLTKSPAQLTKTLARFSKLTTGTSPCVVRPCFAQGDGRGDGGRGSAHHLRPRRARLRARECMR
jgi:hypothetical protein